MISVAAALDQAVQRLETAGVGEARLDAKILMAEVLEREAVGLSLYGAEQLATDQLISFNDLIDRRAAREPVARILERRAFYGNDFILSGGTLDPRADSEALIDLALNQPVAKHVLDLGTGTGCLLLTYLDQRPAASGVGIDMSLEAVRVAEDNARALNLADRAKFLRGNWTAPVNGQTFDLILSNPPYIREDEFDGLQPEVQRWDPILALLAGEDGLDAYRHIFKSLGKVAHDKTHLCLEIGQGQGPAVRDLASDAGWQFLQSQADLAGIERALAFCMNAL